MRIAALVVAAVGVAVGAVAQSPDWMQVTTTSSPSPRYSHAMVYDSARAKVVMFGGYDGSYANDTWEYDGVNWTPITTASSPGPRYLPAMTYDCARGKVVMFGGYDSFGPYLNDTWEYDGVNWTQVATASSPNDRDNHVMVYDSARGKVVMFGGYDGNYLNDTWEFDGVNWDQVTTASSPSARRSHAMAYDSVRGKVVVHGGEATSSVFTDTWEYDGVNWGQVTTASSPSVRRNHGMSYDSVRGRVVMFGGTLFNGQVNAFGDTWEYDGINWAQVATASSSNGRDNHEMAYDSARGRVVMFGGWAGGVLLNDTWEYDGVLQSSVSTYGTGCGTVTLGLYPTSDPIVGTTTGALIVNAPTPFSGVTMGWSDSHFGGAPLLPLDLAFIGMPGCQLLHSNDVFGLPVTPLTATTLQFDFPIPFLGSLLGAHVYLQAYCFAPGENALQIVASNGIDWLIGNQ